MLNEVNCKVGVEEVEYLGHIILAKGVSIDQRKIQTVVDWPSPNNLKALSVFFGPHWLP